MDLVADIKQSVFATWPMEDCIVAFEPELRDNLPAAVVFVQRRAFPYVPLSRIEANLRELYRDKCHIQVRSISDFDTNFNNKDVVLRQPDPPAVLVKRDPKWV